MNVHLSIRNVRGWINSKIHPPVRLHKPLTLSERVDTKALKYAPILYPLAWVTLIILITVLCVKLGGNGAAVESGNYYNHLMDVIA